MSSRPAGARRPSAAARGWLLIAGLTWLISLGLPWKKTVEVGFGFTWYGTGLCSNSWDYDGWMTTTCDPYWTPGLGVQPAVVDLVGTGHPVRLFVLPAVAALIAGYRRGSRALLRAAPALAAFGILGYGVTGMSGQLAALLGLGALLMALHRDGVLPARWSRRPAVAT